MGARMCCASDSADRVEARLSGDFSTTICEDELDLDLRSREALTKSEICSVERTWQRAMEKGMDKLAITFFKQVFEVAPDMLELYSFKDEPNAAESPRMKAHGVKFIAMVTTAVDGLDNFPVLLPLLKELGLRHIGYGVNAGHYNAFGIALFNTLRSVIGSMFNPEASLAWSKVWHVVTETMSTVARGPQDRMDLKESIQVPEDVGLDEPLTEEEIELVQTSWASARVLDSETLGLILLRRVFELEPQTKNLLPLNGEAHHFACKEVRALAASTIDTVGLVVSKLDELEWFTPDLQDLGRKHARYGVMPSHYQLLGTALVKMLEFGLSPNLFNPDIKAAWRKACHHVQKSMVANNYE